MLSNEEIRAAIVQAFDPPYRCVVEFHPLDKPAKEEVRVRVSDMDDALQPLMRSVELGTVQDQRLLRNVIELWREDAAAIG